MIFSLIAFSYIAIIVLWMVGIWSSEMNLFILGKGSVYQIMEMLMHAPTSIVTSNNLMEQIWGWDSDVSVNNIWVYISNLRKKLQQLGTSVSIRAVRGVGYDNQRIFF